MPALSPAEAIARIRTLLAERAPTLGAGHLVCIDGPAGAGKSTLADALADAVTVPLAGDHPEVTVMHLDDLYDGWDGLATIGAQLDALLLPLSHGEPGHYRRYDWHRGGYAESVTLPPTPLLVLEGAGSGCLGQPAWATVTVWVTAAEDVRKQRALARDGDAFAPHWDAWAAAERRLFDAGQVAARADVVVDGDSPVAG